MSREADQFEKRTLETLIPHERSMRLFTIHLGIAASGIGLVLIVMASMYLRASGHGGSTYGPIMMIVAGGVSILLTVVGTRLSLRTYDARIATMQARASALQNAAKDMRTAHIPHRARHGRQKIDWT